MKIRIGTALLSVALVSGMTLGGCANLSGFHDRFRDPYEHVNRKIYHFNTTLDRYLMRPVARGYVRVTPRPIRVSVANFFSNLADINVFLNDYLQGRWKQGASDTGRFLTNSTLGIGGLFDVATQLGMPAHEEDLGVTLAGWGVETDNYLVLPFFGPSSTRAIWGLGMGFVANPVFYAPLLVSFPLTSLNVISRRAQALAATNVLAVGAIDPYSFVRQAYHQRRLYLIYQGNPPRPRFRPGADDRVPPPPLPGRDR